MSQERMSKEQLIQGFAEAFEEVIRGANEAERRGVTRQGDKWGPRETVAHMVGWEAIASVRLPRIVAGMSPLEFADEEQQTVMDNAINAALVTLMGEQTLDTLCGMLRQTYQHNVELLRGVDEKFFQPGEYVYERTKGVIEHCQEHLEGLVS